MIEFPYCFKVLKHLWFSLLMFIAFPSCSPITLCPMRWPTKSIVFDPIRHFEGLAVRFTLCNLWNKFFNRQTCSLSVVVCTKMSSTILSTLCIPYRSFFIPLTSVAPEFIIPKGIFRNSYEPSGVINAVLAMSASATGICQYPLLRSILAKYLSYWACEISHQRIPLVRDQKQWFYSTSDKSTHTRFEPSFLRTITTGDAYGDVDLLMTPILSMSRISFLSISLNLYGMGHGLDRTGSLQVTLTCMVFDEICGSW